MKQNLHITLRAMALVLAFVCLSATLAACASAPKLTGYTFKTPSGGEIGIGMSEGEALKQLGKADSEIVSPSCGGVAGEDCVYVYGGFNVKTTPTESGDVVCRVELTDDSLKTPEGLYIGMTADAAKTAMNGKGTATTVGDGINYEKDGMYLRVIIRNDTVTGIQYSEIIKED